MQPQQTDPNYLQQVFQKVDKNRSGSITHDELQVALSNGTWTPFNPVTVHLMINMFDHDKNGTITFNEFCQLWDYITRWQQVFRQYDRDGSGSIDGNEMKATITSFGYRFSDNFYNVLLKRFDRQRKGVILFDDFIQCCVTLQSMTNSFRQYDTDNDGWVNMSYEQFLSMVYSSL